MRQVVTTHHVVVETGSGDVFADFVDDEDVQPVEKDPRLQALGFCLERDLLFLDTVGRNDFDSAGLVIRIFDQGDAEQNLSGRKGRPADRHNVAEHSFHAQLMARLGSLLLAEADGDHLHQPAFVPAPKGDMRLDPVHQHDAVGCGGVGIEPRDQAVFGRSQVDHVHGGAHGRSHRLLADAHAKEQALLPLGRRPAVTAHGGEDKRMGALGLEMINQDSHDHRLVRDATAADSNGNAHSRSDRVQHARALQAIAKHSFDIRDDRPLKRLSSLHDTRNRNALQQSGNRTWHIRPAHMLWACLSGRAPFYLRASNLASFS